MKYKLFKTRDDLHLLMMDIRRGSNRGYAITGKGQDTSAPQSFSGWQSTELDKTELTNKLWLERHLKREKEEPVSVNSITILMTNQPTISVL